MEKYRQYIDNSEYEFIPYQKHKNGGIQYSNGGTGQINAEVEKEENSLGPNGEFTQFNGNSHSQGGIKTDLPGNSMIFSDKLKAPGSKKTFADINKINNTNKEDKILSSDKYGNISRHTAELMKLAKNKNSESLFNEQESLKQARVQAYAKKMGVVLPQPSMDNEQMEPQGQSEQSEGEFAMGGVKLPMYTNKQNELPQHTNGGYPLDNPYHKFKGSIPMYHYGGPTNVQGFTKPQYEQAQADSMILYKSGLGKIPNNEQVGNGSYDWSKNTSFNAASDRLLGVNGKWPQSISGEQVASTGRIQHFNGVQQYQKPTMNPWVQAPGSKQVVAPKVVNYTDTVNHPVYQQAIPGIDKSAQTVRVENYRNGGLKKINTNNLKPTTKNSYNKLNNKQKQPPNKINTTHSLEPMTEDSYDELNNKWKQSSDKIDAAHGLKPMTEDSYDELNNKWKQSSDKIDAAHGLKPMTEDSYDELNNKWKQSSDKIDAAHGWNSNDPTTAPGYKKPSNNNWQDVATNVGMGLANNASNIYNLSRYNGPELEQYQRAKATYLDPTAAIRDAEQQNRRAEVDVKNASGGNAGNYLSNRVALAAQNTENKDRIRQQYANANAGIGNQNSQFNSDIAMREVIANAQNRSRNRSGKGEAIGSIGSNVANQIQDNKKTGMDQDTLASMMKYYNNPEFQKTMKSSKLSKRKTGK